MAHLALPVTQEILSMIAEYPNKPHSSQLGHKIVSEWFRSQAFLLVIYHIPEGQIERGISS